MKYNEPAIVNKQYEGTYDQGSFQIHLLVIQNQMLTKILEFMRGSKNDEWMHIIALILAGWKWWNKLNGSKQNLFNLCLHKGSTIHISCKEWWQNSQNNLFWGKWSCQGSLII